MQSLVALYGIIDIRSIREGKQHLHSCDKRYWRMTMSEDQYIPSGRIE